MSAEIQRLNKALEGRYTIVDAIGEGGMANVYLADDLRHERKVALKVLKPDLAAVVGAERFLAEIKTTANLQHPHILPLFDSGEADSYLYYVMPYVEGETLSERIERERQLPVEEAVQLTIAVANALQTAHDAGVVHRDIKPGNILLSRGEPLVADFGIALAVGAASGTRLTETGLSIGTPFYMSPEQATGDQSVGPASDTYALACVLYEMLVGEPPFIGNTAQAVLGKIIQGEPVAATTVRKSIPLNIDAAMRKSLEKLPADRFARAADFAAALADPAFRYGEAVHAGVGRNGWNGLTTAFAGVAAVLVMVVGWLVSATEPPRPQPVERFSLALEPGQAPDEQLTISPDGSAMVYRAMNDGGQPQLFLRRLEDLEHIPIPGTAGDLHDPVISPDGTEVAYVQDSELKVAPLAGGLVRTLADNATCCSRWGGDGYLYFSPTDRTIARVPVEGGPVEPITSREGAEGSHGYFQVVPGGEVGVFTVWDQPRRIDAVRLATLERQTVTEGVRAYVTPELDLVFAAVDGRLLAAPFDPESMELREAPVPIVEGVGITGAHDAMFSLSNTGSLLYWAFPAVAGLGELIWVTRDGQATAVDPNWQIDAGVGAGSWGWSLSPAGDRIALRESTQTGLDIWVKTLPDGPRSRLTFDPAADWKPRWSPDGLDITFLSDRSGRAEVWSRRADGTGDAELVFGADYPSGLTGDAFWSPDGEWLVLRSGAIGATGGFSDILAVRPSVDTVLQALVARPELAERGPALSPDGRWLAYSSDETGREEVFVRAFPDVESFKLQISSQGGIKPLWAQDGEELFFVNGNAEMVVVAVDLSDEFRVLGQEVLFPFPSSVLVSSNEDFYDVSPDGSRFLLLRASESEEAKAAQPKLILVQNWTEELRRRFGN